VGEGRAWSIFILQSLSSSDPPHPPSSPFPSSWPTFRCLFPSFRSDPADGQTRGVDEDPRGERHGRAEAPVEAMAGLSDQTKGFPTPSGVMAVQKDESADRIGSANAAEARWGSQTERGRESMPPCPSGLSNGSSPGPLDPCPSLLRLVIPMSPPDGSLPGKGYKFPRLVRRTGVPSFLFHLSRFLRLQALILAPLRSSILPHPP
jgi:hypothetical protein